MVNEQSKNAPVALLSEFDSLLAKHDIKFVGSGTTLRAMRHTSI